MEDKEEKSLAESNDSSDEEDITSDELPPDLKQALDVIENLIEGDTKIPSPSKRKFLAVVSQKVSRYRGPLPPPELLEGYNQVAPGSAQIIIDQFVAQGDHRRYLEKVVIEGDNKRANWGLVSGSTIALVGLLGAFYVISLGYSLEGLGSVVLALGPLIGSLIVILRKRQKEIKQKAQLVPEED